MSKAETVLMVVLQSSDAVVLADPDHPLWMFGAEVTDDGQ